MAEISDRITAKADNFHIDQEKAKDDRIDKIFATAVGNKRDHGVHFSAFQRDRSSLLLLTVQTSSTEDAGLSLGIMPDLKWCRRSLHR